MSRAIRKHWIWRNAEHFKWWFDLVCLASWKDTETLKRGQLRASIRFLQESWANIDEDKNTVTRPSPKRVIAYLRKLEAETLISTQKRPGAVTLITISDYERYQGIIAMVGNTNGNTNGNTCGNKYEEYNNNINNSSTTTACVRTCAREEAVTAETLRGNTSWRECMCMRHHLTQAQLGEYLETFILDCKCNGKEKHQNLSDAMSHCNSWLTRQLNDKRYETTSNDRHTNQQSKEQRDREFAEHIRQKLQGSGVHSQLQ